MSSGMVFSLIKSRLDPRPVVERGFLGPGTIGMTIWFQPALHAAPRRAGFPLHCSVAVKVVRRISSAEMNFSLLEASRRRNDRGG